MKQSSTKAAPARRARVSKGVKNTRTAKTNKAKPAAAKRSLAAHVIHHSKRAYHATPKFIHGMVAGAFLGVVIVTSLGIGKNANALTISSTQDCTANAVLHCGAQSTQDVQSKYGQAGAAAIYDYYGIKKSDIDALNSTAVAGVTYKDGTVAVNGKTVAKDASSTGRQAINGSHAVSHNGVTFYETTNQAAFRGNSINVFVVMKNGQFAFAIMGACGNPVKGTPTTPPTPTPKPTPTPTPTPTPKPTPTPTPTPTPVTPTPTTPVTVQTTSSTTPTSLPNTGPAAALVVIALLSIAGGYAFHLTHHHIQRKKGLTKHHATKRHHRA